MSVIKDQVRKFYEILWNAHDKRAIPKVLHEKVTFRGSLGQEKQGYDGFAEYVDMIHGALGDYRCVIEDIVAEEQKVFAKVRFAGIHQGDFLGHRPTLRRVTWVGCALFTFEGDRVKDVWVLGDLKELEGQLKKNAI